LKSSLLVWIVAIVLLAGAAFTFTHIGGEFMPALEEGNLWIRATMQQDIAFPQSADLADQLRSVLRSFPEVTQCLSQMGRPDDGTDVSTFNNIELLADLKPAGEWRPVPRQKGRADRRDSKEVSTISGHRLQLFAKHPGQRGRGDVRCEGRKLAEALRR
jgi:Cu/Ag efflux pump CusA